MPITRRPSTLRLSLTRACPHRTRFVSRTSMLTLAVTCFHAPADRRPPDVDPDLRLIAIPRYPDDDSTDATPTLPAASDTTSGAPRTNNRIHSATSSMDKCSPYLPPNTSSQPPVPIVPTSSPTPHPRGTLSGTMIPRRSPMPPIERAPFDVAIVLPRYCCLTAPS